MKIIGGNSMFCRNCGAKLRPGALFCNSCGTKAEIPQEIENESFAAETKAEDNSFNDLGQQGSAAAGSSCGARKRSK